MIADSSYLVAFFLESDDLHTQAVESFNPDATELIIPDRVLEETISVITYKRGIASALEVYDQLMKNRLVRIRPTQPQESHQVFELMRIHRKKMSFTDYLVAYLAKELKEKPVSFDRQLLSYFSQGSS